MDPAAAHSCHLLQQLHEQRIQGLLCDCTLVVKGVCFKAHKNVLAAFSQYFRSLFQNSSGQKNDVFHLDIKNVSGIGQILDFMYTSHLDLNQGNVQIMLDIAQCLQVPNVLSLCHTFLKPTTGEQPPSTLCSSAFPTPGALTPNSDCVIRDHYPPLLPACSAQGQPSKVLDDPHSHGSPPVTLHPSPSEASKQAPAASDGECPEPFKQPNHYSKLRNFYSKQYYKHAACPGRQRGVEQPLAVGSATDLSAVVENQPCALSHSECVLEATEHLPSNSLSPLLPGAAAAPEPEPPCHHPAKQMRLKKAVHLKKLNFLKSQRPAEPDAHPSTDGGLVQGTGPAQDNPRERINGPSPEREEQEGLGNPERFSCDHEVERPEEQAPQEDQSPALQTQRQYACELCGKPFKHPSNLELHRRSHTGEKPFECNICGKHFSQAGNLQTHLRRHSGEKPYICEICGKRFAASGDVQRHIIIHSGEKPHLCDICGRGFSNFSNLKEHKKTHTADKVFTCDECGKSFNMQRKLVKHRVRHTGQRPYSCAACGKCFGGSGDLRRHVRTHTGEKPYTCEICDKCFTRSAVLRRHRKMHCRAAAPDVLEELAQAMDASDLEQPQGSDSFTQDMAASLLPAAGKLPGPEAGAIGGRPCKFRSLEPPARSQQEKLTMDPEKLAKAPLPPAQQPAYTYTDVSAAAGDELPADGMSLIRSSLAALDNQGPDALGSRTAATAYRNSEGQFFSGMTLWGLAMKTLQNEGELEQ
ncbi:zinc finger and BTB domain-containing protein 49 isoform X1 [Sorex fumeus]|uniref:zinc finger and BTB domain-containing protein 49 isoform X1 n=2 Tax=Sorex fumeus TaxID=62283 RepID=UPI0024AE12A0|nr:zinc finger and BTB domain-containing protein 49 isoform X1 [Sorex fumeus]